MIYYVSIKETKGIDMEQKIVGNRIKELMKKKNMTIKDLSEKMGVTSKTLSKKLNGEQEFCVSEILIITKIFNLSIEACARIFFGSDDISLEARTHK